MDKVFQKKELEKNELYCDSTKKAFYSLQLLNWSQTLDN